MSSDDSDVGHLHKRKRKSRRLNGGSPSSSDGGSPIIGSSSIPRRRMFRKSNRIPVLELSDTDSDSGSSIHRYGKRKKVERVVSDTDSDTSGSTIIKRTKRTGRIPSESEVDSDRGFEGSTSSQWETDFSDNEMQKSKPKSEDASLAIAPEASTDSDSSDGQSEKCPICLRTFRLQEIGTPETCDHMFCLECIQEWSKNINTCPVDRQEYTLVLVRKNILGKVIRQIPIEKPVLQNDLNIIEDPTFCEICGSSENEDRMLLCDGCDLGFHLYCLRPALDDVPVGAWFCQDCSPDDEYDTEIELNEIEMLLNEVDSIERLHGRRRRLTRLIPRTRQSERVRRRIANNRQQNSLFEGPSTSSSLEESQIVADPVSSTTTMSIRVKKSKKPKKRKRKTTTRYKIVYEIDPNTGEAVPVRKRQKKQKIHEKNDEKSPEGSG
ncbi:hypothetical protein NQ317_010096 [Molorchus minor]|uniref:PHD and RING finger domain-containing protein 1 n=1 Tax=Molorchus minor TaxID=1323400 RepID=A0ABQ9JFH8_9CUCU|nr:hypothetical protein NQ317_010096 [Molorchus minor]